MKARLLTVARPIYRAIVPDKLRLAFRHFRHPEEKSLLQLVDPASRHPVYVLSENPREKSKYERSASAMKITYLSWTIPYPLDSGGKIRTYNLLRYLAERHIVHLHVPAWQIPEIPEDLKELFASFTIYQFGYAHWRKDHRLRILKGVPHNITSFYTTRSIEEFQKLFSTQATELVFVDESGVAPYARPLTQVPCILARQKADHLFYYDIYRRTPLNGAKLPALIEALLYRLYEYRLWRRFKYGVVVSEEERNLYLNLDPTLNLAVIPNGVDISYFQMTPLPTNPEPVIMFHGLMSFYPNIDAATWFVEQIFPLILERLPQTKLLIVGRDPVDEVKRLARPDRIIIAGGVSDMRDYLKQSHVVIAPIRIGHGTRLKISEAMAVGRPVVATPIGAEGLAVEPGQHLLLAEQPEEFAANVVKVLTNRSLAENLAINGRQLVESHYSWQSIGEKLEQYCQSVIERHR